MKRHFLAMLLGSSSPFWLAAPAYAQDTTGPHDVPVGGARASSQASPQSGSGADIVVTGSRIVRDGYNAPTPVTVAPAEDLLKTTPSSIADAVNKLPQFQLSSGPSRSVHNFANTESHGNLLNLRGVGPLRTLILFDGQRMTPTTYTGAVDVGVIPNLLIQRVDIVTGGASATYGSDAVSGVVNFVLNRSFTGLTGNIQAGTSARGDNGNQRIGVAGGFKFANGAGHVLLSAEYSNGAGMLRSDRTIGRQQWVFAGSVPGCLPGAGEPATVCSPGGTRNPYTRYSGAVIVSQPERGIIASGPAGFPFTNYIFLPGGAIRPLDRGTPTGSAGFSVGGDGTPVASDVSAVAPLKTYQMFGRASYDVTPDLTAFVQGNFSRNDLAYTSIANSWGATTPAPIFSGNPYLPAAVQAELGPNDFINVVAYNGQGPKPSTKVRTDYWMATAGLEGRFNAWHWNLSYTHGESRHSVAQSGIYNYQRAYAAIDAVRDGSGNIVCRATLSDDSTIRARFAGCSPLNILGVSPAEATPAGYAYATGTSQFHARLAQDSIAASINGGLFKLPAGDVDFAAGAEYRRQSLDLTSNANPALLDTPAERSAYFAGLRNVAAPALFYYLTNVGIAHGKVDVKEAFAELNVPVLRDTPFFHSLALNAAGRVTDYSTTGTVVTWKFGSTWQPIDGLLLRGTYSRDIRAPALFDLYAGDQSAIGFILDPVSGIQQNVAQVNGGNRALKPERSKTLTLGGVLTPAFFPGFSLAVDYYSLRIDDAIGSLGLQQIVQNCFAGGTSAPECGLITRPSPTSFPSLIRVAPANIAFLKTSGIDFDASYRRELGARNLSLRLYASYLNKYLTQQFVGAPVLNYRGIAAPSSTPEGRPKWHGTLSAAYQIGGFEAFVSEQYIGPLTLGLPGQPSNFVDSRIKSVWYTDLTLSYRVPTKSGSVQLFATINNLFDKDPPIIPATVAPAVIYPTIASLYDVVGRSFTAGVRFKF